MVEDEEQAGQQVQKVIYEQKLEKFEEDNFRKMEEEKAKQDKKLTVFQATLAVIASIIGGGIICIPYAMTTAGFINGAIINFATLAILMYCAHLYIRAMDMFGLRSISELSYMCFGRYSVYIINGLLVFVFFGYLVMFEILFSNLATSVVLHSGIISKNGLVEEKSYLAHLLSKRQTYVVALTVFQIPIYLKRSLSELKCQSKILFLAIILMIVILFMKTQEVSDVVHKSSAISLTVDYQWEDLIDAVNITLASYGFICSLFPILQEMQDGSYQNGMIACFFGLLFCFIVYALFAILALFIYGNDIQMSIFDNFDKEHDNKILFIQSLFLIIFFMNIPYNFYPGKVMALNVITEYRHRSFSKILEHKINKSKAEEEDGFELQKDGEEPELKEVDPARDTDDFTYNTVVLVGAVGIAYFACIIDDLSFVFGVMAAFSEALLDNILPGIIFILAVRHVKHKRCCANFMAFLFAFVGLIYFILTNYWNVIKFQRELKKM